MPELTGGCWDGAVKTCQIATCQRRTPTHRPDDLGTVLLAPGCSPLAWTRRGALQLPYRLIGRGDADDVAHALSDLGDQFDELLGLFFRERDGGEHFGSHQFNGPIEDTASLR